MLGDIAEGILEGLFGESIWAGIIIIALLCGLIAAPFTWWKHHQETPRVNVENPMIYKLDEDRWQNSITLVRRLEVVTVSNVDGNDVTIADLRNSNRTQTITEDKFRARYVAWMRLEKYEDTYGELRN